MSQSSFSLNFYRSNDYPTWASEFQGKLNQAYLNLPWPKQVEKIALFTQVVGGKGDISAGGKVINLLGKSNPKIKFEWFLNKKPCDPKQFLDDPKRTQINPPKDSADLLITGPVNLTWSVDYVEATFDISKTSSQFSFTECGTIPYGNKYSDAKALCRDLEDENIDEPMHTTYAKIHSLLFTSKGFGSYGLPIGLKKGMGILLDPVRLKESSHFEVSSASFLDDLEDKSLREDVTKIPHDNLSINSGYVHHPRSWHRYVDFVTAHEKKKNVLIILNQKSEFEDHTTKNFADALFTPERLAFLRDRGYGQITIKGTEKSSIVIDSSEGFRTLTLVVRPNFLPQDMAKIQLASERIASTGNNSSAEAFACKCKMYFYENVFNGMYYHSEKYLKEQIALANEINPNLARFIELEAKVEPLIQEELQEALKIIDDPELEHWTLQLCKKITDDYSFDNIFLGALKRYLWHHFKPSLVDLELSVIDDCFKQATVDFLTSKQEPRRVEVKNLNNLSRKLENAIALS